MLSLLSSPAFAADTDELADCLSEHVLLYASADVEGISKQSKGLDIYAFFNDPEIKAFAVHLWDIIEHSVGDDADRSTLDTLTSAFNLVREHVGSVSFAVIDLMRKARPGEREAESSLPNASPGFFPGMAALVCVKNPEAFKKGIMGLFSFSGAAGKKEIRSYEKGDVEIRKVSFPSKAGMGPVFYLAFWNDRVLISNSGSDFSALLDRLAGGAREEFSLARNERFKRLKGRLMSAGAAVFCALNVEKGIDTIRSLGQTNDADRDNRDEKWISWLGWSLAARNGFIVDDFQVVYSERTEGLILLDAFSSGVDFSCSIPSEAVLFFSFDFNPTVLFSRLKELMGLNDPEALASLRSNLAWMSDRYGIDVERALGCLGENVTLYLVLPKYGYIPELIIVADLKEKEPFLEFTDKLKKMMNENGFFSKQFSMEGGLKGSYFSSRVTRLPFAPAFCVSGDRLYVGGGVRELRKAIKWQNRESGERDDLLLDSPEYKATLNAAMAGREGCTENLMGVLYLDEGRVLSVVYSTLAPWAGMLSAESSVPLDITILPTVKAFDEHIGALVAVLEEYRDGEDIVLSLRSASSLGLQTRFLPPFAAWFVLMPRISDDEPPLITHIFEEPEPLPATLPDRAFVGVMLNTVEGAERGVLVVEIVPGSPAEEAELAAGDVLLKIGGTDVDSPEGVGKVLALCKPGDSIEIEFERNGELLKSHLVLARLSDFWDEEKEE